MSLKHSNNLNLEDILTDRAYEEDFLEIPLADRAFNFFSFLVIVVVGLVFFQLVDIGVLKHSFYENRASANASYVKTEPVPRGIIVDRFGEPLIKNEPASNVYLAPRFLPQESSERLKIIKDISLELAVDQKELTRKIAEKNWNNAERILLADDIQHDQLIALSSKEIPGLEIESSFKRTQSMPFEFSHVLGYTGFVNENDLKLKPNLVLDDEIGKTGLEAYYDEYLRGVKGQEVFFRNAKGQIEDKRAMKSAQPGYNLETFIDGELQDYFHKSLKNALARLGRNTGLGIAFNPQNGEVLSLFSVPSFDSSGIAEFLNDPTKPLFNRAVGGLYNPGSTIKPLVATAALVEGVIDPAKQIYSAGYIELPNPYDPEKSSRFLDWKPHGWVDLRSAIARSSNVYFYEIGGGFKDQKGLGIAKLKEWWQRFGFGEKTNIDLIGEKFGFLPDPEWKEKNTKTFWRLGDTYNVSIGQGDLSVTPLELLNYISAIANGGKFYKPRVMKEIKNEKGEVVLKSEPVILKDESDLIGKALIEVGRGMRDGVEKPYGTAHLLNDLPMSAAAKTGSAQVENNAKVNAFVVAYAPYENPQIAILVLVENAREGSLNVVPVANEVLMWYYKNRINPS